MDLIQLSELLKIVAESGVAEIEIEEDDYKLVVRKNTPTVMLQSATMPPFGVGYMPQAYVPPSPTMPSRLDTGVPPVSPLSDMEVAANQSPTLEPAIKPGVHEVEVRAPIVGTFYRASALDATPFVQEGDEVELGDVLCVVEAMKLMNEIECEVNGTVKRILVENAQPVEYDQPLFIIEQN